MPHKPDTPCSGCGKLLWGGTASLPAGERKCQACRRAAKAPDRYDSKAEDPGRNGRPWRRLRERVLAEEASCFRCGEPVDKTLKGASRWAPSVDHIVALADGGAPLDRSNVALAHQGCNSSAGQRQRNGSEPERNDAAYGEVEPKLGVRGKRLWREIKGEQFDPVRRVLLEEACRLADRLDRLDASLVGRVPWGFEVSEEFPDVAVIVVDKALAEARQQAMALKQLIAELRQSGADEKPQTTGGSVLDQLAARRASRIAGTAG